MERWPDEPITTRDARLAAQRRLQGLGHPQAQLVDGRDGEADIVGPAAVARLELGSTRTGVDAVQALAGLAAVEGKAGSLFSLPGFTDEAIAWADRAGIALFVFDRQGHPEPVGRVAADAVARSIVTTAPFGTGDLADPAVVAAVLTDGLVADGVREVGLWSSGAGQILTFRLEPGDRHVAACVVVRLYPPVLPDPLRVSDDWEQSEHRFPGGGYEQVWSLRCVQANQPPTAVAGEAVLRATEALEACGVDFASCRVELRAAPAPGKATGDGRATGAVLGPVGRDRAARVAPGVRATSAEVVARLLEQARDDDQAGEATVEGVSDDGAAAWRLTARLGARRIGVPERWHVEAEVPARLMAAERGGRWFRPAEATVGATRWVRSGGRWITSASGPDLENLAHEVVADLAAVYAVGGQTFEDTALAGVG